MTKNATNLDQTTANAYEISESQLDAVSGGWRPHRVYVPRASAGGAEARGGLTEEIGWTPEC